MSIRRAILVTVLLAAVLNFSGCFFKKKKPPVPPQAQAPATTTEPQPAVPPPPPAATEPNRPQPEAAPATATAPPPETAPAPPAKPKHTRAAKKVTPPPKPQRTIVEEGGAKQPSGPQLSASIPHDKAVHQQLNTTQLLEATEYNLKSIARALSADEQAMVQHIRSYIEQSRDASKDGDVERAYNLALKAHLLCDELTKR